MTALGFGAPLVLWALLLLPVLWWLMRSTPPRPRDITFAPTRLLMGLAKREETPSRTPWWLMALRLALAACVIIALAQPILRPEAAPAAGDGPALILVDNTFGAAADWTERTDTAARLIDEAEAADRAVIIAGTADAAAPLTGRSPGEARDVLRSLQPQPWNAARAAFAERLAGLEAGSAAWLADGLGSEDDGALWDALDAATDGPIRLFLPEAGEVIGIADVSPSSEGMSVTLTADAHPGTLPRTVRAVDPKGFVLAEGSATFRAGSTAAVAELELPTELRNDALRVTVAGERNAAAVRLLDERFRRRTVGLISGSSLEQEQPLLSPLHYLRAALGPSADPARAVRPGPPHRHHRADRRRHLRHRAGRRRHASARHPGRARPLDQCRRRAPALRRAAHLRRDRRPLPRSAALRRPHPRRHTVLERPAAAVRLRGGRPLRQPRRPRRRHGDTPAPGRAVDRAERAHLGHPRRRDAPS